MALFQVPTCSHPWQPTNLPFQPMLYAIEGDRQLYFVSIYQIIYWGAPMAQDYLGEHVHLGVVCAHKHVTYVYCVHLDIFDIFNDLFRCFLDRLILVKFWTHYVIYMPSFSFIEWFVLHWGLGGHWSFLTGELKNGTMLDFIGQVGKLILEDILKVSWRYNKIWLFRIFNQGKVDLDELKCMTEPTNES